MAKISSIFSLDMSELDLNRIYSNYLDSGTLTNQTYNGNYYSNVLWVEWNLSSNYYTSVFGGYGFSYNSIGDITAGTATGYLEMYWNGKEYSPYFSIENASLPAIDIWQASTSESTKDDQNLLKKILSGDDTIQGSNQNDVLLGYSGNDAFSAGLGNDLIIGGEGFDTLNLNSVSSSNVSITKTLQGYKLISSYGTDEIIGVEQLELQDGLFALSDLTPTSEKIYVLILDNFGYSSATNENVIFLDYDFSFIDGWENYQLDSLEPDELAQLPYEPGFGTWRVPDDNGTLTYSHYFDHTGNEVENQDFLAGDNYDNDTEWDYFIYSEWIDSIDGRLTYFVNDLDGIDTVPWLDEGLEQGMYLLHYNQFTDLDGETDFFNNLGTDDYFKVDQDTESDYVFFNWETDSTPDLENGEMVVLSASEVEALHLSGAGDFSEVRFHGDIVLDNFYSKLDPALVDDVVVITVDIYDNHYTTQDEVWIYEQIGNGNIDLDLELQTAAGVGVADLSVISLSVGSIDPEADLLEQTSALGPTIVWALPNGNKWGDRFWDAYLAEDVANTSSTLMVSGFDGFLPEGASQYADIFYDRYDSELSGALGTSFATPKAAAELVNYEAELLNIGSSLADLSTEELIDYLNTTSVMNTYGVEFDGALLAGTYGDDTLTGGDGSDFFLGFEGNDLFNGGAGDDYFLANLGIDTFNGGDGSDTIITDLDEKAEPQSLEFSFNTVTGLYNSETISSIENFELMGNFNLTATGGAEDNRFIADAGDDLLHGGAGNDMLYGGAGNDAIYGEDGMDRIIASTGGDLVYGGTGEDILDFSDYFTAITIDTDSSLTNDSQGNSTWFNDIENFYGTAFNDALYGRSTDESVAIELNALNGDTRNYEYFRGNAGADIIDGRGGYDELSFSGAQYGLTIDLALSTVDDGLGYTDTISNIEGVEATNFNDSIYGTSGDNSLDGRLGNNYIDGREGFDFVEYNGSGRTNLVVNLATGSATFTQGSNYTDTLINIEGVIGSDNDDSLTGDDEANKLFGAAGADLLVGGLGNDTLDGGSGNDSIFGGEGMDLIVAATGVNEADGGEDEDVLDYSAYGTAISIDASSGLADDGAGNLTYFENIENFYGTALSDTLQGRNTDTSIAIELNALNGDVRNYEYFKGNAGNDVIDGRGGYDEISLTSSLIGLTIDLESSTQADGLGYIDTIANIEGVEGTNFDDTIYGTSGDNSLDGRLGNNYIDGRDGFDFVEYNGSGRSNLVVSLATGIATFTQGSNYTDTLANIEGVIGSENSDEITGTDLNNKLYGAGGDDLLAGLAGTDLIYGGSGADEISGGLGEDQLFGDDGNDTLLGEADDDVLSGGNGNDSLEGGLGDDILRGGSGNDTFIFRGTFGHDTLFGYDELEDTLYFEDALGNQISTSDFNDTLDSAGRRLLTAADGVSSITFGVLQIFRSDLSTTIESGIVDLVSSTGSTESLPISSLGPTDEVVSLSYQAPTSGAVAISDVIAQLRHIVGLNKLTGLNKGAADNNGDGEIAISDVISSLRQIVGLEQAPDAKLVTAEGESEFLFNDSIEELYVVAPGDADLSWSLPDMA
jgi:Ca2+-binding RTX toxin-like protein